MGYYRNIDSSKKKVYSSYDALPLFTQKVYSALRLMCTDVFYWDEDLEFTPTNRQIAEISGVTSGITHHLAVLDRNGYIRVTWTYQEGRRKHRIELLDKEENKTNNSTMEV